MKRLNLNQKKAISELLINLSVALISIAIISQIFMEKNFDQYYLQLGIIGFIISLMMIYASIYILKNKQ
ncbi:MAG: hypothetical protein WC744_00440 [Patescibacteria group bacterium]